MKYIVPLILIGILISCSQEDKDLSYKIGEDWLDGTTKVYYIDTLTIKSSTFQFDSLAVTNPKRLLIGSYLDPIFGRTESKSFVQLMNDFSFKIDDDAQFDSIAFILKNDHYFYNDTIASQNFTIHRVLEDIEPDEGNYYNISSFDYENTSIGFKNTKVTPSKNDSISIKINNSFGNTLFKKIKEREITNSEEFLDEYKGLLIKGSNTNTAVLGFTTNSLLRVYYTINNENTEEKTLDFKIVTNNAFNQIVSDKKDTYFSPIIDQKTQIFSTETANNSFIQAGIGLTTRIDIPTIESLYDIPGDGVLIAANLQFSLKRKSNTDFLHTKDSLRVHIINHKAEIIGSLTSDGAELFAIKNIQDNEFDLSYYNISIKQFLDLKLSTPNEEFFLAIYPKELEYSVDRYILNGENNPDDQKIKLEVIYAIYDDQ